MGAPFFTRRAVEDAARDLMHAAQALQRERAEADRIVADLEARWAGNRAARNPITPAGESA
jgi:hypothetical protein